MNRLSTLVLLLVAYYAAADCAPGTTVGPCLCLDDSLGGLALECTGVVNGSDVTAALEQIQVAEISSLEIKSSPALVSMPDDAFGTTAVKAIRFYNTGLQSLSAAVFGTSTAAALTSLYIKHCRAFAQLDSQMVGALTALEMLFVSNTGLTSLDDPLPATPVTYIDLTQNDIATIVDDYFANAPNLVDVLLSLNALTHETVMAGMSQTFAGPNSNLYLDFAFNSLQHGMHGMVFPGAAPRELIMSGNNMTVLSEIFFSDVMAQMAAQYGLTDAYILIDNNPLTCGCDAAWIVDNPNRALLTGGLCTSGQLLDNLDATDFAAC